MIKKNFQFLFSFVFVMFLVAGLSIPAQAKDIAYTEQYSRAAIPSGASSVINILIQLEAPVVQAQKKRAPVAVSLVIDCSGSMSAAKKLDYAIEAGKTLVRGMEESDQMALVVYASDVRVLRKMGPLTDKQAVIKMLEGLSPMDYTNLSGGLEGGIKELGQLKGKASANEPEGLVRRVILLSDGLANKGVTNGELVAEIGAKARKSGLSVSSIGLGTDYDENLMQLLAQRGGGAYYYVKDSEDLPLVFKQELNMSANLATRGLRFSFEGLPGVKDVKVYGYNTEEENGKLEIESSDLGSGEKRQILLRVTATPEAGKSLQELGKLHMEYNDAEGNKKEAVIPLKVQVAADAAAATKLDTEKEADLKQAREEALLVDAEEAQVAAMKALEEGKMAEAKELLRKNREAVMAAPASPVMKNKAIQLEDAENNLEAAAQNMELQKDMVKGSKAGMMKSAQGSKQSLMLQKNDRGFMVEKLQNALKSKGFYKGEANGAYDSQLEDAVKAFQKANNLDPDGIAGQDTMKALGL